MDVVVVMTVSCRQDFSNGLFATTGEYETMALVPWCRRETQVITVVTSDGVSHGHQRPPAVSFIYAPYVGGESSKAYIKDPMLSITVRVDNIDPKGCM